MLKLKKLFEKIKLSYYKEIILVDSENIGYRIPSEIPKRTLVYMFISDTRILAKLGDYANHKQIRLVDIARFRIDSSIKNIMDFCIVTQLAELVSMVSPSQKLVICSNDRGYDASINYLKEKYPSHQIKRHPGSLFFYYVKHKDLAKVLKKMDQDLLSKYDICDNMEQLKKFMNKKQKQALIIQQNLDPIALVKTYIELDLYTLEYCVYSSGNFVMKSTDKNKVAEAYKQAIDKINKKFVKFETRDQFLRSIELNIREFVEEADLKNMPLKECLISHLGEFNGHIIYQLYKNETVVVGA